MTSSANPELQEVVELLIRRRLQEHNDDLAQRKGEIEKNAARHGAPQSFVARALLVGAWSDVLQKHCKQVLTDLMVLLKIFDNLAAAEWIRQKFSAHVDQVTSKLVRMLTDCRFGVSSRSSERNKVTNMSSAIKARAKPILDIEVERAAQRQRKYFECSEPSASELDDRLPLNRRGSFDLDLEEMVKAVKRSGEPLSLAMIDIDHFKRVNDQYGHPMGDEVLLAVSALAIKRLAHKGKAYRYGGEEFALLLPNYSVEEAVGLAERIRKDIEDAIISGKKLKVTASFGVAAVPDHAADSKTVLKKADTALYEAKKLGRNRVRFSGEPKLDNLSPRAGKRRDHKPDSANNRHTR